MTSIATLSGRVIDFLDPEPHQVNLDDLASGLGRHARYTGQTVRPYTVAQHSLLVAALVEREHRLHALLHDAPEAYTGDAPSPLKAALRAHAQALGAPSSYDAIERGLWEAICRRYDISPELPEAVVRADRLAMLIEAPVLQPKGWNSPVWNWARGEELEVAGLHRGHLTRILALPNGGGIEWMWAVVDHLAARG